MKMEQFTRFSPDQRQTLDALMTERRRQNEPGDLIPAGKPCEHDMAIGRVVALANDVVPWFVLPTPLSHQGI
jgi:hypothetical protein